MVFSSDNYIVAIILLVMILLAIIGYFAERANNKKNDTNIKEDKKDLIDLTNKRLSDFQEKKEDSIAKEQEEVKVEQKVIDINGVNAVNMVPNVPIAQNPINSVPMPNTLTEGNVIGKSLETNASENAITTNVSGNVISTTTNVVSENSLSNEKLEKIDELDKELDILLPKEKLLNEDLLSDIDFMELDKTQKLDLSGVPDLDNIDLPKIKQFEEEEDIWKI